MTAAVAEKAAAAVTAKPVGTPARTAMEKLPPHLRLGITLPGMRELFAALPADAVDR